MTTDTHKKPASGDGDREAFEREFSAPPFELPMQRWPDDGSFAWPGNYQHYPTQLAFDAWAAALRYCDELEKGHE